jgi:hypothetical protein
MASGMLDSETFHWPRTSAGGIYFLPGKYSWACDNVVNYGVRGQLLHAMRSLYAGLVSQLVTAVGAIIDVNETSYLELY